VQLSITQQVLLDGAVIVSTPQDIALLDAVRGVTMFKKVNVKILGMVQNMSFFNCPNCGHTSHVFGDDGVSKKAKELGIERLVDVPLHADVCETSDSGTPIVVSQPSSLHAKVYLELADKIWAKLNK
jgi:ATP-binding protein involved in chromosome partitioning